MRLALVTTALAVLVACGPRPAPWAGLVKVGLIQSFHGLHPQAAMAVHVALRQDLIDRNAEGGVRGLRLELSSLDDHGDPELLERRLAELSLDPLVFVALVPEGADPKSESLPLVHISSPDQATATLARVLSAVERAAARGPVNRETVADELGVGRRR